MSQPKLLSGRIWNNWVLSSQPIEIAPERASAITPTLFHPPS